MRGRKPKPTALKLHAGNPGKRALNRREPKPTPGVPTCPAWLDATAKAKWREVVPELVRLNLLTVVDGEVLAAWCQAWAEFGAATKTLRKEGRTYTCEGKTLAHPAAAQQRYAMDRIRAFAALFGLDPSSRARLQTEAGGENRPAGVSQFARRRGG